METHMEDHKIENIPTELEDQRKNVLNLNIFSK